MGQVRGLPGVEYVEQDGVSRVQAEAKIGDFSWGIDRIDHGIPKSFDDAYTPHISGKNITCEDILRV